MTVRPSRPTAPINACRSPDGAMIGLATASNKRPRSADLDHRQNTRTEQKRAPQNTAAGTWSWPSTPLSLLDFLRLRATLPRVSSSQVRHVVRRRPIDVVASSSSDGRKATIGSPVGQSPRNDAAVTVVYGSSCSASVSASHRWYRSGDHARSTTSRWYSSGDARAWITSPASLARRPGRSAFARASAAATRP